ncbi:Pleckstrin homology domain,IRS-type PTB domain,PH domain-like [Cinara cedri]|uniref:Insulin receptor substrate 1 n=1 Tax=Cinara cedri TaxID=506608 RepID=A0A5E4N4Y5_9HEMI|nr:Pleckstrin homology domain,IRS-type PTB domain,PH domain-like [Cinara cedri]
MCLKKIFKMSGLNIRWYNSRPKNAMVGVVKIGYLKKNKSTKKKFFVLRELTAFGGPACLEYYDTEKKWRNNGSPNKVIVLKACFNITKRVDSRTKKTIIRINTSHNNFSILFDTDTELDEWLDLMLVLQRVNKNYGHIDSIKEPLEHIWHVVIMNKGLGNNAKLLGMTGLCLCDKTMSIMKYPTRSKLQTTIDINLSSIRRSGALGTVFYMEVGQSSPFGPGQLWLDALSSQIAKSIHGILMGATSQSSTNHDQPKVRARSSSFNEGSRLMNCSSKQRSSFYDENNPGLQYKNNSQSFSTLNNGNFDLSRTGSVRERCDSMPLRPRAISENYSTHSYNGILSPRQSFHRRCNCVSASSSISGFSDSGLSTWDTSLSKLTDTTDGNSSCYTNFNNQQTAILEENHEDFVSCRPLDKEEDLLRQTTDSNVNNNINLINNNFGGNRSSSSSQAGSCCDSNSPYGSPTNGDEHPYTLLDPSIAGTSPPTDGYLPMKPGSKCTHYNNYTLMEGQNSSKQDTLPKTQVELVEGYVPMAPVNKISSEYVPMECTKQESIKSGTPSTDTRFSSIHLDRVCSMLAPLEDEEPIRATRAYSVGSKDGLREKIDKINADRARTRAFSVGSRGQLPPSGLNHNDNQSGDSTSVSEQSDSGNHMEINFSCNSKLRRNYKATYRSLSAQAPADSSPKLCPSPDSCTHRSSGRSPPKSIASIATSVDNKRTLSGAVHGISRSPPSSHTYLSPTLERVSEVPGVEVFDNYTLMKPVQGLFPNENVSPVLEESSKRNYVNVWEAASNSFPLMKIIGGLNWKKNKKRSAMPVQLNMSNNEGIDEVDCYTTIRPGVHTIPLRSDQNNSKLPTDALLNVLQDELADLVLSDQPIDIYNSKNCHQSENSVSSLDG